MDKPVGTIKCKNRVTIIKKRMAGFDRVETPLKFLPLEQFFLTVGQNNFGNKIPLFKSTIDKIIPVSIGLTI